MGVKKEDTTCEWRIVDTPHGMPIYNTGCGRIRLNYSTGYDIYCNACGRKINIVNDKESDFNEDFNKQEIQVKT